jgi:hypothetical protein
MPAVAGTFYIAVWRKYHRPKPWVFLCEGALLLVPDVGNKEETSK